MKKIFSALFPLLSRVVYFVRTVPDSRLVVIDTLQKIRTASKDNAYASDYGDISLIKDFADRHNQERQM